MLVIHPNECIDCGVCEPVCPAKAIIPDTHPDAGVWPNINARYAAEWPAITEQRPHAADADSWRNRPGKYELVFGVKPIS